MLNTQIIEIRAEKINTLKETEPTKQKSEEKRSSQKKYKKSRVWCCLCFADDKICAQYLGGSKGADELIRITY